jgi:hypothetical protein
MSRWDCDLRCCLIVSEDGWIFSSGVAIYFGCSLKSVSDSVVEEICAFLLALFEEQLLVQQMCNVP